MRVRTAPNSRVDEKKKRRAEHDKNAQTFKFQPRPVACAFTFDPSASHKPTQPTTVGSVSKYMVSVSVARTHCS